MPYDANLAERVRQVVKTLKIVEEKRMFGGVAFFVNGHITVGVWKEMLIARLGVEEGEQARREPYVRDFDITGKPMSGWVMVEPAGLEGDDLLANWIQRSMRFVKTLPKKSGKTR